MHKPSRSPSRMEQFVGLVAGALVLCITAVALALKALARGAPKPTRATTRRSPKPSSARLGWFTQLVLGVSFAVTIAGALALCR